MEGGGRHQCRSAATEGLAVSFGSICYKCISHSQDTPPCRLPTLQRFNRVLIAG